MEQISDELSFSRPQLLSTGIHSQVVLFNYKQSRSRTAEVAACVLKFYRPDARFAYENELSVYRRLLGTKTELIYPKPFGYSEWSSAKYVKAIGRGIKRIVEGDASVYVLMLEYMENATPLSSVNVSSSIAESAISSLCRLHNIRIVHGDISTSNALVLAEHEPARVAWIDFSSASTLALQKDLALETDKAIEYFGAIGVSILHA
jgi:RIO-like serine/threonine protein kinase